MAKYVVQTQTDLNTRIEPSSIYVTEPVAPRAAPLTTANAAVITSLLSELGKRKSDDSESGPVGVASEGSAEVEFRGGKAVIKKVENRHGTQAGASSSEFDSYRATRKREVMRLEELDRADKERREKEEAEKRRAENAREAELRTAKKAAMRHKKKENMKKKREHLKAAGGAQSERDGNMDNEEDDAVESTEERVDGKKEESLNECTENNNLV